MLRTLFILSIVSLFAFSSCKKTGSAKACFDLSKETIKVGDTMYLLNCSENYEKFIWLYDYNGMGLMLDSIDRHAYTVPAATGSYDVILYVGKYEYTSADFTKFSVVKKTFKVE